MQETYKPFLIIISTQNLINHIKVKADSVGSGCTLSVAEEDACGDWADGSDDSAPTWGNMCVDIGPLLGCNEHPDWYCSTVITPIAR